MDTITVIDENGNNKTMEVCLTFNINGYDETYLIYNELDKSHYYIGKYSSDNMNIDTNLTKEEYDLCDKIFEKVVEQNVRN